MQVRSAWKELSGPRVIGKLGASIALAITASVIASALSGEPASAHTRPYVVIKYATASLQAGGAGEVSAAVSSNSECRLTIKLRKRIEVVSATASSPIGDIYSWRVPAKISPGVRTALVTCDDGAKASTPIAVTANAESGSTSIARFVQAEAITATDSPAETGKGDEHYPTYGSVILSGKYWFGGNGVNVYSDGINDGSGYYQGVELANRFMTTEGFGPVILGKANKLYKDAPPAYYKDYPNGSGYTPVPGDLIVFGSGKFGHVAIVDSVTNSTVNLVEENASPTGLATMSLSGSTLSEYGLPVIGIIHAIANNSTNPPAPPKNPSPTPTCSTPGTYNETTGGVTNTWTDYTDAGGTEGPQIGSNVTVEVTCRVTGFTAADGDDWWYQIASSPWNNTYYVSADAFYNNGQTSGSLQGSPFYDPNVPTASTYTETTGGVTNTWTDYSDAGGTAGRQIGANDGVQVACAIIGFTVADGNTWWYQIASSPWNNTYYASADAFYNNGQTSGSLVGTPFVDPNVPTCLTPGTYDETTGGATDTWTDYADASGTEGPQIATNVTVEVTCRVTGFTAADGDDWWYQIASSPWNYTYYASASTFYNNGQTSGSLQGLPVYDPNVPVCSTSGYSETTGGVTNTWTDYTDAGGTEGQQIGTNVTVEVTCRLTGFAVADGNTWWYQIASPPWSNVYYASADAFYNNGQTSGSLVGTPFYDPNVPIC